MLFKFRRTSKNYFIVINLKLQKKSVKHNYAFQIFNLWAKSPLKLSFFIKNVCSSFTKSPRNLLYTNDSRSIRVKMLLQSHNIFYVTKRLQNWGSKRRKNLERVNTILPGSLLHTNHLGLDVPVEPKKSHTIAWFMSTVLHKICPIWHGAIIN